MEIDHSLSVDETRLILIISAVKELLYHERRAQLSRRKCSTNCICLNTFIISAKYIFLLNILQFLHILVILDLFSI